MGLKSVEIKELKKMEKLLISEVMEEFPEIEMLLEFFSPETAELIKKHPQRALVLYNRYKPLLDDVMTSRGIGPGEKQKPYQY
uniref:Uncharacterized protein n=1 Tax=uncultured microorganism TaxID=358574 RepID=I2FJH8_9ZZZZ|nr:hypothetical protein [uncultured microorganism]